MVPSPFPIVFSLLGLYLHIEHGYTGKQVQRAHMQLARVRRAWPSMPLPAQRGDITVHHVLAQTPGPSRDAMIEQWCRSVWAAYGSCRSQIAELAQQELGVTVANS